MPPRNGVGAASTRYTPPMPANMESRGMRREEARSVEGQAAQAPEGVWKYPTAHPLHPSVPCLYPGPHTSLALLGS
jgi:hypothetical protein